MGSLKARQHLQKNLSQKLAKRSRALSNIKNVLVQHSRDQALVDSQEAQVQRLDFTGKVFISTPEDTGPAFTQMNRVPHGEQHKAIAPHADPFLDPFLD